MAFAPMADKDSLTKRLEQQADDLKRIIEEAQRLRGAIHDHIERLRDVHTDRISSIERRKKPR